MPHETDVATMFRKDLSVARKLWIETVKPGEQDSLASDFLLPTNHSGESLDFHALRHTTGAWLSMTGAHPKVVQTLMRHSTINLTMDTYGHLFPSQESDAVNRLERLFQNDSASDSSQGATLCESEAHLDENETVSPDLKAKEKPLLHGAECISLRQDAALETSSGGGIRTPDTRIMIPLL